MRQPCLTFGLVVSTASEWQRLMLGWNNGGVETLSIDKMKYCALCLNKATGVWTISRDGDSALVPLCEEHAPQLDRLFRLCRDNAVAVAGEGRRKRRTHRPTPLDFTPLEWQPGD